MYVGTLFYLINKILSVSQGCQFCQLLTISANPFTENAKPRAVNNSQAMAAIYPVGNKVDIMIVKERDSSKARLSHLENLEIVESDFDQRRMIHNAKKRLCTTSPTAEACAVIDELFAASEDWMVIHDLRLTKNRRIVHVNHLLINSSLEFIVIDSRYLNFGLSVCANGTWRVHTRDENGVISSPVSKLYRDTRSLKGHLDESNLLPSRFGIQRLGEVRGYVLVNPSIRTSKTGLNEVDAEKIVSADNLFRLIWRSSEKRFSRKNKKIPLANLQELAQKLAMEHQSLFPARFAGQRASNNEDTLKTKSSNHRIKIAANSDALKMRYTKL